VQRTERRRGAASGSRRLSSKAAHNKCAGRRRARRRAGAGSPMPRAGGRAGLHGAPQRGDAHRTGRVRASGWSLFVHMCSRAYDDVVHLC
jgi:hypothetical protein